VQSGTADSVVITSPAGGVVQNTYDLYMPPSIPVAARVLVQHAQSVNISNIAVDGSNNMTATCGLDLRGIYYQNASGTLGAVVTRNQALAPGLTGCQSGQGIFVQSGYGSSGPANVVVQAAYILSRRTELQAMARKRTYSFSTTTSPAKAPPRALPKTACRLAMAPRARWLATL
jgi:hypothetical protein